MQIQEELSMVKKEERRVIARNKRASHDYFILEELEVGIVLTGTEIKSIRASKASINEAYVQAKKGLLTVENMHISTYKEGNIFNHKEIRSRVLLAHKKEILKFENKVKLESMTIVPLELYIYKGLAKLKIALCKGKKNYDKRESIKQKDIERNISKYK